MGRTGCQFDAEVVCASCGKLIMLVPDDIIDNAEPFTAYCDECVRKIGSHVANLYPPEGRREIASSGYSLHQLVNTARIILKRYGLQGERG